MKLLSVMAGFFPGKKYGGPPVSIDNFCSLMRYIDCYVICKDHDMGDTERYHDIHDGWNIRANCSVQYLSDEEYCEKRFERIIVDLKPDVIYLQGLFQSCVWPCLKLAKKYDINVLLAPRGELCAGAFRKKYKKIPYILMLKTFGFTKKNHFQSTSNEETKAITKWMDPPKEKIHYLTNIPSITKKKYLHSEKKKGEAKIVFLSRIHPKKNLKFALQCLKNVKGQIQFDIYGPLEDRDYWTECKKEIAELPQNIKANYCGLVGHDDVHETFSKYDVFFFPTLSENFGHVIAEALMVGCPVIISNQTPFSNVSDFNSGFAFSLDHQELFVKAVQYIVDNNNEKQLIMFNGTQKYIEKHFNLKKLQDSYMKVLEGL